MARAAEIESDPFFELLTDALRAGPGSPQWHQAVQRLRQDSFVATGNLPIREAFRSPKKSSKATM